MMQRIFLTINASPKTLIPFKFVENEVDGKFLVWYYTHPDRELHCTFEDKAHFLEVHEEITEHINGKTEWE
jgi:hypothetical protein